MAFIFQNSPIFLISFFTSSKLLVTVYSLGRDVKLRLRVECAIATCSFVMKYFD